MENVKDIFRIVWYLGWRWAAAVAVFCAVIGIANWEWWR